MGKATSEKRRADWGIESREWAPSKLTTGSLSPRPMHEGQADRISSAQITPRTSVERFQRPRRIFEKDAMTEEELLEKLSKWKLPNAYGVEAEFRKLMGRIAELEAENTGLRIRVGELETHVHSKRSTARWCSAYV